MAGSWRHAVWHLFDGEPALPPGVVEGQLRNNEDFVQMVENLGDAFETVEEMYGMVQVLAAALAAATPNISREQWIENARQSYKEGVRIGGAVPYDERGR